MEPIKVTKPKTHESIQREMLTASLFPKQVPPKADTLPTDGHKFKMVLVGPKSNLNLRQ